MAWMKFTGDWMSWRQGILLDKVDMDNNKISQTKKWAIEHILFISMIDNGANWRFPYVGVLDAWQHWWIGDSVRNIPPYKC